MAGFVGLYVWRQRLAGKHPDLSELEPQFDGLIVGDMSAV